MRIKTILILGSILSLFSSNIFSQTTFSEQAAAWGINIGGSKDGGHSYADYDGDGDLDLLINTYDITLASRLYRNNGNNTYTDVTSTLAPALLVNRRERCAIWGDLNNDGLLDFVRNTGSDGSQLIEVYLQGSNGIFGNGTGGSTPIYGGNGSAGTDDVVIANGANSEGVGLLDFDGDGDLDIILDNHNYGIDILRNNYINHTNNVVTNPAITSLFSHATPGTTPILGLSQSAVDGDYGSFTDVNDDGWVDIFIRKQTENDFFLNQGGTFTNGADLAEANNNNKGSVVLYDLDNDGDFDAFWTENGLNQIFRNNGGGSWTALGAATGIATTYTTRIDEVACGDLDNDGDIDILLVGNNRSYLYYNQLNDPVSGVNTGTAMNFTLDAVQTFNTGDGESTTMIDIDEDGDLDISMNINGSANQLWINNLYSSSTTAANKSALFVEVLDNRSNYMQSGKERPALGATIVLLDCNDNVLSGIREVNGGTGHGTQGANKVHFGLPWGNNYNYKVLVRYPNYVNGSTVREEVRHWINPIQTGNDPVTITIRPNDTDVDCPVLLEVCTNGIDDDGDGLVDCADPDCYLAANSGGLDTDNDGISNTCDQDDDNDGILDNTECPTATSSGLTGPLMTFTSQITTTNASSAFVSHTLDAITYNGTTYTDFILPDGYSSDFSLTSPTSLRAIQNGATLYNYSSNANYDNDILTDAFQTRNLNAYQQLDNNDFSNGDSYSLTYNNPILSTAGGFIAVTERKGNNPQVIEALDVNGNVIGSALNVDVAHYVDMGVNVYAATPDNAFMALYPIDNLAPVGSEIYGLKISFGPTSTTDGPDAKVFLFGDASLFACDYDSDGIHNHLDLDSDNDGCPDAIEGGGSFDYTDIDNTTALTGSVGSNGIPTQAGAGQTIETSQNAAQQGVVCNSCDPSNPSFTDNDNDGVGDDCDDDDDNDGILDTDEYLCGSFTMDLSGITSSSTNVSNVVLSGAYTFDATLNPASTSTDAGRPTGFANGALGMGYVNQTVNNEFIEYTIDFSAPVMLNLSQAEINGWFDDQEQWTLTTVGAPLVVTAPVISHSIINDVNNLDGDGNVDTGPELRDVTGNNTNTVSFVPNGYNGHMTTSNSQWSITSDGFVTSLTIRYNASSYNFSFVGSAQRGPIGLYISCIAQDTDGDGIPNHEDLDSDNDGCPDALEGGGSFTYTNIDNTTALTGSVGSNGIPTQAGAGQTIGTSQDENVQNPICSSCHASNPAFIDNDNDGIGDDCDDDDDNDGILDVVECPTPTNSGLTGPLTSFTTNISTTNASSNAVPHTLNSITYNGTTYTDFIVPDSYTPGFTLTDQTGVSFVKEGAFLFNIGSNANYNTDILPAFQSRNLNAYQDLDRNDFSNGDYFDLKYNSPITSTAGGFIAVTERGGNNPQVVQALDASGSVIGTTVNVSTSDYVDLGVRVDPSGSQNANMALYPIDDLAPVGTEIHGIRISFGTSSGAASDGPDAKAFLFGDVALLSCDYDGDGIPNHLDLDSDNDGCSDVLEGGGSFTASDLANDRLSGAVNSNGVPTAAGSGQTIGNSQDENVKSCPEICNNGSDDDGDGLIDCLDPDCGIVNITNTIISSCIDQPYADVAKLDITISWSSAPTDSIEVTIVGKTEYINTNSVTSPTTVSFMVPADGSTNNTITTNFKDKICTNTSTFNAPAACSNNQLTCSMLYICGDSKQSDADAFDHGLMQYIDGINGNAVLEPALAKNQSGMGLYDPNNPSTALSITLTDYDIILVSSTTWDDLSADLKTALKNTSASILLLLHDAVVDLGLGSSAWYSTQSHGYSDNTTQVQLYNFNNNNPRYDPLVGVVNYFSATADAYLWKDQWNMSSNGQGLFFHYDASDALTGVSASHGSRTFLGYYMDGVYWNNDTNGGAMPVPAAEWFDPIRHLTQAGKLYLDQAINLAAQSCTVEDCTNNQDDDGDGLIDCADPDCKPVITIVNVTQPTCINKMSGEIIITATGSGTLSYSITNETAWQASNTFSGLGVGQYTIRVKNDSGCETEYTSNPVVLDFGTCVEICNNGQDDDGDGLIDCDDPDCEDVGTGTNINNN